MTDSDIFCPCLSGKDFAICCGPWDRAATAAPGSAEAAHASLRRLLLRALRESQGMMEMWFAFLDELPDASREGLTDGSDRQILADHFLWDWFHRHAEARPLCRAVRAVEGTDLRASSHLEEWTLAAWEPWEVASVSGPTWSLKSLVSERHSVVHKAFAHHDWNIGDGLLCRILPHLGHHFTGLSVTVFPGARGRRRLKAAYNRICDDRGIHPHARLRPDVHNEDWLPIHGQLFLLANDLDVAAMPVDELGFLDTPVAALGGASPRECATHELGRHRLRRWLAELEPHPRSLVEELIEDGAR